jgi:hypothetical protein
VLRDRSAAVGRKLLLVNVGLVETVKLVPQERWREALARVHGGG